MESTVPEYDDLDDWLVEIGGGKMREDNTGSYLEGSEVEDPAPDETVAEKLEPFTHGEVTPVELYDEEQEQAVEVDKE